MAIEFVCRKCGNQLAQFSKEQVDAHMIDLSVFHELAQQQMMREDEDGGFTFEIMCEDCEKVVSNNPYYYEINSRLQ